MMEQVTTQGPDWLKIAEIVVTFILGVAGAYLAHSYQRQLRLRVADKRLAAYSALWANMRFASPVRLAKWIAQTLTYEAREQLFYDLTEWYYANGNGMFLGGGSRAIYLRAKDNLVCPVECYEPEPIRKELDKLSDEDQEEARGYLAVRQLSLLRNRMKADLDVYGLPYHVSLDRWDIAFLESCGEKLWKKPWRGRDRDGHPACENVPIFPPKISKPEG